jgi:hypothetical protein
MPVARWQTGILTTSGHVLPISLLQPKYAPSR